MGRSIVNLVGRRFNMLQIINFDHMGTNKITYWLVRCDCGIEKVLPRTAFFSGGTKSCGCTRIINITQKATRHGKSYTPEHKIWDSMIQRCTNPNDAAYARYGGRGITVCERWKGKNGFIHFYADVCPRPNKNLSLDRIDNEKGYSPENCRWATREQQQKNRRNIKLTYEDEADIVYFYRVGAKMKDLAKAYSVVVPTISRVIKKQNKITKEN
jgi:hypothetical protein